MRWVNQIKRKLSPIAKYIIVLAYSQIHFATMSNLDYIWDMLILQLLMTYILSVFDAWHDARRIKAGERIYHIPEAIWRLLILFFISWGSLPVLFVMCSLFWITFELHLNQKRGLPWDYVGHTWIGDKIFSGIGCPGLVKMVIKVIFLIISTYMLWDFLKNSDTSLWHFLLSLV